ncbi:response regulator [Cohnella sp. CFH 77786]|uniref:response regulator n=1 Tax=Cohnella sp. CFH 77786 TaxID=2662265 RepID=UPI001C60941C|nr:response regulator [Cohnella sp. CFH 77786]MBW5447356.1 response regulator [Cohnella sp. CFH 77786]
MKLIQMQCKRCQVKLIWHPDFGYIETCVYCFQLWDEKPNLSREDNRVEFYTPETFAMALDVLEGLHRPNIDAAIISALKAAEIASMLGVEELEMRAQLIHAEVMIRKGLLSEGGRILQQIKAWAESHGCAYIQARCHRHLCSFFRSIGDMPRALEHMLQSCQLLPVNALPQTRGNHLLLLGAILALNGEYDEAKRRFQETLDLATETNQLKYALITLNNMAYAEYELGNAEEAAEIIERIRQFGQKYGLPLNPRILDTIARVQILQGRYEESERTLQIVIDRRLDDQVDELDMLPECFITFAAAQRLQGAYSRSQATLDEALRLCEEHGFTGYRVSIMEEQAELYAASGRYQEAYKELRKFHSESEKLRSKEREARAKILQAVFETEEAKRASEYYMKKRLEADEANRAKGQFLARMSHEIRTPLNAIIGLAYLLQKTELTHVQKDYLAKIHSSSQTLLGMVNDVLDFSKIESGQLKLEQIPFQLTDIMNRIADILSLSAGQKSVEIIIEKDPGVPPAFIGDPFRIEQVILNLCNNALKFTNDGYVLLSIGLIARQEDKQAAWISFSITDTGIGISEEQLQVLFTPFTQADISMSRRYGGSGLGLAICKLLAQSMGGDIEVESRIAHGSKFTFKLPLKVLNRQTEFIQRTVYEGYRVIFAGNHPIQREVMERKLSSLGFTPHTLASCEAMFGELQSAMSGDIQLLIADSELEGLGDAEWTKLMELAKEKKIKVLELMTATEENYKRCERHQADAMLTKPATSSRLLDTLEIIFGRKHLHVPPTNEPVPVTNAATKGHLLVAEDNEINQIVIRELLQQLGYSVTIAGSGAETMELLNQQPWEAVLMDLHMPEMDGFATVRKIRSKKEYNRIPVIALTANVMKKDHEKCLEDGMNDILTKPVEIGRLSEVLGKWVRLHCLLSIEGLDAEKAIRQMDGKAYILQYALGQFKQHYRTFQSDVEKKLPIDRDSVFRMVHSLKGVAANLYAEPLLAATSELEAILAGGIESSAWRDKLAEVQTEIDRLAKFVFWK